MATRIRTRGRRRRPVATLITTAVSGLLVASVLAVVPGLATPAMAAPVADFTALQDAVQSSSCPGPAAGPVAVELTGPIGAADKTLTVGCDAQIDLRGHDLAVLNIVIEVDRKLEVTDTSASGPAGKLTADADTPRVFHVAGIQNTGATFATDGRAEVEARGGPYGAGIGGGRSGDGGKTISSGSSKIIAFGGGLAAGIGGGGNDTAADPGGDGWITESYEDSEIIATGGAYGAGIGGGAYGDGGVTASHDNSTITATGQAGGSGIGGGGGIPVGGRGGVTTVHGGTITATGDGSADPIGAGRDQTGYGKLTVKTGGELVLHGDSAQTIPADSTSAAPLFEVESGATVSGTAKLTGPGWLVNHGIIKLGTVDGAAMNVTGTYHRIVFDTDGGPAGPAAPRPLVVFADTIDAGEQTLPFSVGAYRVDEWHLTADRTGSQLTPTTNLGPDGEMTVYGHWRFALENFGSSCVDSLVPVVLHDDYDLADTTLDVGCNMTLDLAGHDLTLERVRIGVGESFSVTDRSTTGAPGTLLADARDVDGSAAINNTGAAMSTSGRAHVVALGGAGGAGIGGDRNGDGGTVRVNGGKVTATPGAGASPIGAGQDGTAVGEVRVWGGVLELASGTQTISDGPDDSFTIRKNTGTGLQGTVTGNAVLAGPGTIVNLGALTMPTANIGVKVSDHHYRVTFDLAGAGGAAPPAVTVFADTFANGDRDLPPTPTRPGYTFSGWSIDRGAGREPLTDTTVLPGLGTGAGPVEITAYATWSLTTFPTPAPSLTNATDADRGADAPQFGDRLEVSSPNPSLTYAWQRIAADGTATSAGEGTAYTIGIDDLGHRLSVVATAAGLPYVGSATSPPTGVVVPAPLPDPGLALPGDPRVGEPLTADYTLPEVAGLTATWRWETIVPGAEEWTPVPEAAADTYLPTRDRAGQLVRVTLVLAAPGHAERADTAGTGRIADLPSLPVAVVELKGGRPKVGKRLRVIVDRPDRPATTVAYQWQRTRPASSDAGPRWRDIRRATTRKFTPRPGDLGRRLRVITTVSAPGYVSQTTATTVPKRVVKGKLPKPPRQLTLRGPSRVGGTLQIVGLDRYAERLPRRAELNVVWLAGGTRLGAADAPAYTIRPAARDQRIRAKVTVTAPGYRARTVATPRTARVR